MKTTTYTLRALAALLRYPDGQLRLHAAELRDALHDERALTFGRLAELDRLLDRLASLDGFDLEADYVDTFDRGRRTALHLFEHVHGDSRDRGPAMVDLAQTYERAGLLLAEGELPDYLPVLLEFASTQPAREARSLLAETAHIVRHIFSALLEHKNPAARAYASVLAAVLDLAGEKAEKVPLAEEPGLDDAWAEPEAFGGCSTQGQAKPQPVHIVRGAAAGTQAPLRG